MANRLITKSQAEEYCRLNGYKLFIDMCIKDKVIVEKDPETKSLFVTEEYIDRFGTIKVEMWSEGLVLWVGGQIVYNSWS